MNYARTLFYQRMAKVLFPQDKTIISPISLFYSKTREVIRQFEKNLRA